MGVLTQVIYDKLAGDAALAALLGTYGGLSAVFTTDPAPGDAALPYIVTAGSVAESPADTKTTLGRVVTRDVRCYAAASGSAETVEEIAERVRALLHRQALVIPGFVWVLSECAGPMAADEQDAYGRVVTISLTMEEL